MTKKKNAFVPPITDEEHIEYVIYCRKSTDESANKQIASIPRQIDACIKYAQANNLTIRQKPQNFPFDDGEEVLSEQQCEDLDDRKIYENTRHLYIVKEQKSAKEPRQRKKWSRLMRMVESGEIRGLLSYSPDRQARNIVEGGELIDFADKQIIDLKYTNFHFEPTASGKMMLGIWFVFSKQYSDKLSEDVTNANQRKFEKGETLGDVKHGYARNEDGKWEPDENTFELIKQAFAYRIEEEWSDRKIAEWLNQNGYYRTIKSTGEKKQISKSAVNNIWTDPFYYGLWIRADEQIDLREDKEFVPMISYPQHEILCDRYKTYEERNRSSIKKEDDLASVRMVENNFVMFEDKDGNTFNFTLNLPNRNTRHRQKLLELQKTKPKATLADFIQPHQLKLTCTKHNINISLDEIDRVIEKKLSEISITQEDYDAYLLYTHDKLDVEFQEMNEARQRHQLRINQNEHQKQQHIKKHLASLDKMSKEEREIYEREKKKYADRIEYHKQGMADLESKEEMIVFGIEIMLKFMKNAVSYYKKATYVQKAEIIKILFLNIRINQKKQLNIAVNPDIEHLFVLNGRGIRTDFEHTRRILNRIPYKQVKRVARFYYIDMTSILEIEDTPSPKIRNIYDIKLAGNRELASCSV